MDGEGKAYQVSSPLPETVPNPMLTRMLEVAPLAEGEGGNQGATASAKEAVRKGRIENSPGQGKKRTASKDPKVMASKRGKKSSPEGSTPKNAPVESPPKGDRSPPIRK